MALQKTIFEQLQGGIGIDLSYWRITSFTVSRNDQKVLAQVEGYFNEANRRNDGKPMASKNITLDVAELESVTEADIYKRLALPIVVSRGFVDVINLNEDGQAILTGEKRELTEDINPFTGAEAV